MLQCFDYVKNFSLWFLASIFLLESSIDCIRHAKAIHWSFQTEEVMENKRSQLVML